MPDFDWASAAEAASAWLAEHAVAARDAILLVPYAQLLAPARRAWARRAGWMPRIETTRTLAAALAPPPAPSPGELSFDLATDRLAAARLLAGVQAAQAHWARDPSRLDAAAAAVAELAQALARAAAAVAPAERDAYWQRGRAVLGPGDGPGATERLLARIALEWAATRAAPSTDVLHALRPAAWIAISVGGADGLVDALLAGAACPTLRLDADLPLDEPFATLAARGDIAIAVCDDFEDEAQRAAACVLRHLQAGAQPVALVAQDRGLVRRVRALLDRQQVPLADETGWRLSTTRAAARLMALLQTLDEKAACDDLLDWLKAGIADGPALRARAAGSAALERRLRRQRRARLHDVDPSGLRDDAAGLWDDVRALRDSFGAARARSLEDWCGALSDALARSGDAAALQADAAGQQLLEALRLGDGAGAHDATWRELARSQRFGFERFRAWVDDTLEGSSFIPAATPAAPVVVTPLARAMLRPFAALVLPGADELHLGPGAAPLPLLGDAQAVALGLGGHAARREAELLAFAQALRQPRVDLLLRRREGSEPLAASPLLERWLLARRRAGQPAPPGVDGRVLVPVEPRATPRPRPVAPALVPLRWSASALGSLRTCPYQCFAAYLLGLREQDELDDALEKRDYGIWLHAVLLRFHLERPAPRDAAIDRAELRRAGAEEQAAVSLDAAEFLPFEAGFERFVPHYVEWLQQRDAEGARWRSGEETVTASPEELDGAELFGRIDRVDGIGDPQRARGQALELIDYKTGDAKALKRQVRQPAEDTQLAFYAALATRREGAPDGPVHASYLALGGREGIARVEHEQVELSARVLVEGFAHDLARLRAGAPLPALGEGEACERCSARGLCRRDDWAPEAPSGDPLAGPSPVAAEPTTRSIPRHAPARRTGGGPA